MTRVAPRYRALALLHRNGAVSVYDAWSEERGCRCVVKVARRGPDAARERRALAREGRLLLSLSHPHIVRAYELLSRPRAALVLETLPGETLAHALHARGPLRPGDVARLGLQLCSAVEYLHHQGVLHLDLKPSNVICHGGLARLIDLGIARAPGRGHRGVGSAPYLAPEQARGTAVTSATDVFGIGAVLYEAATGRPPFRGSARGFEQLRRRARVRDAGVPVPGRLARVVDRCLHPDASARPGVEELRRALRRLTVAAVGHRPVVSSR
jgi:serine/threonine protein kinase